MQTPPLTSRTVKARQEYEVGRICELRRLTKLAMVHFGNAVSLAPDESEYVYRLAGALRESGRFDEALTRYERAVDLNPDFVEALLDMAGTLRILGRDADSIPLYQRAIALRPGFAIAHNNLGNALLDMSQYDMAIASLKRAVDLGLSVAQGNLGSAFLEVGRLDEAQLCFRRALSDDPRDSITHSNLVFALAFDPRCDDRTILNEARSWARTHVPVQTKRPFLARSRDRSRRLRIGYVSPDFRDHCQAAFMIPLIEHHDSHEVQVYCYSSAVRADSVTERICKAAHHWRDIGMFDDLVVTDLVLRDEIDVLVDLTMHMARGRPKLFANRPAPVQVCWLAYPGTTGLDCIDYRLSDPHLDPPNADLSVYAERTHRLAQTFWCYHPLVSEPMPGAPPFESRGYITFGCLNAFRKINDDVIDAFAAVLRRVAGARMTLLCPSGDSRGRIRRRFGKCGVDESRVNFVDRTSRSEYFDCYRGIDICLDTFPYNGHTTSLDALWMGVPVISLVGNTIVGRAGLSQATNLQLMELVASTRDEYVSAAVSLALDGFRLAQLRGSLRQRMEDSPLMNAVRFAREVETAYRTFWEKYCGASSGS